MTVTSRTSGVPSRPGVPPGRRRHVRTLAPDITIPPPPPPSPGPSGPAIELDIDPCLVRSEERRRQWVARSVVGLALAATAGLTVAALVTVPSPAPSAVPRAPATAVPADRVSTAGLAPSSIEPSPGAPTP